MANIWSGLEGGNAIEAPTGGDRLEIWAFAGEQSYGFDQSIELFVHTTAKEFSIDVVNDTGCPRVVARFDGLSGERQPMPNDCAVDPCEWQNPITLEPTDAWGTGAFVVVLHVDSEEESISREAFFVRRPRPGDEKPIAMVLTTCTWQAYNDWGRGNHYRSVEGELSTDNPLPEVSRRRPWARGLVRLPDHAPRHSDVPDLPLGARPDYEWLRWAIRNQFTRHYSDAGWAYYERPFAHWMEAQGYAFDVLTQDDLHFRSDALEGYRTALLIGHDEYWSRPMRQTMDAFIENGGNLARFAGNMIWQVRFERNDRTQICHRLSESDPITATQPQLATAAWDSAAVGWPATQTFGLSGLWGVYHHFGMCSPRSPAGYTVYRPKHWALAGTDLQYGDMFGAGEARIVSFEVDGLDYTFRFGLPYPTGRDGAPESLEIIALSPASAGEPEDFGVMVNAPLSEATGYCRAEPMSYERPADSLEFGCAAMVSFNKGKGRVFNSGCCEWVSGLIKADPAVVIITKNVLDALSQAGDR